MLKFEVPAFNRLFKTEVFSRIRARCKDLRIVFAISNNIKLSSEINALQKTDIILKDDLTIKSKYNVSKEYMGDLSNLYLFDAILGIAEIYNFANVSDLEIYKKFIEKGFKISIATESESIINYLSELDRELSIKTTILYHCITMADLFLICGLKKNALFTLDLQRKYTHLNRWIEWVQGLLGVDYDRIMRQIGKKGNEQLKALEKLTSSKELLDAVKSQNYERVIYLLDNKGVNIESKDFTEVSITRSEKLERQHDESPENTSSNSKKKEAKKLPIEQTPLHIACDLNDIKMVKILIERGAKVNSGDRDNMTPLYYAILRSNQELCDYLLEKGADLEHRECQYRTPLYWTASLGELDMLEYLIKKGANVNAASKLGRTALSKACWNGQTHIVLRLLKCKNVFFIFSHRN